MCIVCDAKNRLFAQCEKLEAAQQGDLALKFRAFADLISSRTYDAENANRNREIKIKMLDLATRFAAGYMPITVASFQRKLDRFKLPGDDSFHLRLGMRSAMADLFSVYGNRLPWALYGGFMFMASRPNLHVAERLPDLRHLLPEDLPWECVDAVWHGFPPATALYLHILSVINSFTGTVPLHGCGCNHYLPPVRKPGRAEMLIAYPRPADIVTETEVPLAHCLVSIEALVQETFVSLGPTTKALQHIAVGAARVADIDKATGPISRSVLDPIRAV